ncbi:MAG: hypothetical protein AAF847_11465 [Bacteroidota bacterium]
MSRINKRKAYKSRRERAAKHWRNLRLIILFASIAALILFFMNRHAIFRWIGTYFY